MKLCSILSNFHIHVSISDLHIPMISPPILLQKKEDRSWEYVIHSQIENEAAEFLFWEFINRIFFAVYLTRFYLGHTHREFKRRGKLHRIF